MKAGRPPWRGRPRVPVLLPVALDQTYDYLLPDDVEAGARRCSCWCPSARRPASAWSGTALSASSGKPVPDKKLKTIADGAARGAAAPGHLAALRRVGGALHADAARHGGAHDDGRPGRVRAGASPASACAHRGRAEPPRMTPARQRAVKVAADGLVRAKSALAAEAGCSTRRHRRPGPGRRAGGGGHPRAALPAPNPAHAKVEFSDAPGGAAHAHARRRRRGGFSVTLLDGVTGSGKTEVYFEAVARTLERGRQALIMLPEIALTSQFMDRFTGRFGCAPVEWHSALSAPERARAWRAAASGEARVVVGARSALFLPYTDLGLIVVDEEHDGGFKQEDRVHYQARDMAVVRASLGKLPGRAGLGHALHREPRQRPHRPLSRTLRCPAATPASRLPEVTAIDMRETPPDKGRWLAPPLVERHGRDAGRGPAGAALSQPPRLRAAHAVPLLRPSLRLPAVHGLAGRAPLPQPPQLPPLRLLAAAAGEVPQVRRRRLAGRLRPRRRAHRRGGGGALPRRHAWRCSPPTSCPSLDRDARDHQVDRDGRGRDHHRHADGGQGPPLPAVSPPSASSTATWGSAPPIRAPPSAPSSCCTR